MPRHTICTMAELAETGARGFEVPGPEGTVAGFAVLDGDAVHAYVNSCPHAGNALDWAPHRFLTRDRTRIMCSAHGAVFEKSTGRCVQGPCVGRTLENLSAGLEDGKVVVEL